MYTPGASCVVGKPQYRPNVSDGFSNEEKGLRCLSWTDVEDTADEAGGAGGPGMQPTQCHQDAITALEVSSLCPSAPWLGGRRGPFISLPFFLHVGVLASGALHNFSDGALRPRWSRRWVRSRWC